MSDQVSRNQRKKERAMAAGRPTVVDYVRLELAIAHHVNEVQSVSVEAMNLTLPFTVSQIETALGKLEINGEVEELDSGGWRLTDD